MLQKTVPFLDYFQNVQIIIEEYYANLFKKLQLQLKLNSKRNGQK